MKLQFWSVIPNPLSQLPPPSTYNNPILSHSTVPYRVVLAEKILFVSSLLHRRGFQLNLVMEKYGVILYQVIIIKMSWRIDREGIFSIYKETTSHSIKNLLS